MARSILSYRCNKLNSKQQERKAKRVQREFAEIVAAGEAAFGPCPVTILEDGIARRENAKPTALVGAELVLACQDKLDAEELPQAEFDAVLDAHAEYDTEYQMQRAHELRQRKNAQARARRAKQKAAQSMAA